MIDWADVCAGDALFDLAVLTLGFAAHLDDVERGYGCTLDRDVVRAWWSVHRLGSIRWMIEHGLDPSGDIDVLMRAR